MSFAPTASIASRTPATLWLERLSMMTVSPRERVGTSTFATEMRNAPPVMGPPSTQGATVAAQAAGEGCGLPMPPRGLADEPLAPATSSVDADHLGVGARLVDEHQLGGVKACLACLPALARQVYVGPVLFCGVQRFFEGDRVPFEEATNRGLRSLQPKTCQEPLYDRFQRQVRFRGGQVQQPSRSEERRVGKECRSRWS